MEFDNIEKMDAQINRYVLNYSKKMMQPVAAFITFETQEGYERACNIKGHKNWKMQVHSD